MDASPAYDPTSAYTQAFRDSGPLEYNKMVMKQKIERLQREAKESKAITEAYKSLIQRMNEENATLRTRICVTSRLLVRPPSSHFS
jgi:hypothetical protein